MDRVAELLSVWRSLSYQRWVRLGGNFNFFAEVKTGHLVCHKVIISDFMSIYAVGVDLYG